MSPRLRNAYLRRVEARLQDAEDDLARLHRMSPDELDLLILMERGWGPEVAGTSSEPRTGPAEVAA